MRFTTLLFITLLCLKGFAQTFNLDTTFAPNSGGPNLGLGPNGVLYTSAIQPDGKIIVAGNFTSYDGVSRKTIARLHPNGNIDTSFVSAFESFNTIRHIEILSNGKILVTGNLYEIGSINLPSNSKAIARLNSDGTKDLSFNQVLPSAAFDGCKELANGKIIVYGSFTYINGNGNPYNKIGRLNSDGSLDLTFYQSSGGNYAVLDVIELPNEQLVAVGDFTQFDGSYFSGIVRLNSNGSVDGTFLSPGSNLFNENRFKSVKVQSDGKYIAAGRVISSTGYQNVYRFNTDGTLDLTFYSNGTYYQQIEDCAIQNDDKIILSGYINDYDGQIVKHIFRINADGTFDSSFQANTKFDAQVDNIHLLSGDTLIVTGYFSKFGANRKMRIAKLDPNGNSLDNFPNIEGFDLSVKELKIQSDDKVVVVGAFSYFENTPSNGIIRLTQNGEFDSTFIVGDGAKDAVNSLFLQSDGKIIIGGKFTTYNNAPSNYLIRINSDGSIDNTFNVSIDNEITKIFPLPDGRFIIIGNFTMVNGVSRIRIARMLPNWTLDMSFNPGTGFNGTVNLIDVNAIGKILVGGNFTSYNGLSVPYITMLNSNGSLDNQFSSPLVSAPEYLKFHTDTSWFITNGTTVLLTYGNYSSLPQFQSNIDQQMFIHKITGVLKLPDDRYIFHGHFTYIDENGINQNLSIIRTNSSFVRETGFESNYFGEINSSALQSNGKLICGGNFTGIQFNSKNKIARVLTCPEYIIQHVSSCPGYTWTDGTTYNTTTNLPIQTLINNQGCDSVIYLNLTIQPTFDTTITLLNYSNSYTWSANGNTYFQSGTYTDTLTTILGCDSIVHLNLMFVPSPEATEIFNDWIPNGNINDIDYDSLNNRMILAGDFTGFKRKGNGTKILDQITGLPTDFLPASDFAVEQIVSDGSNGYFVIGQFNVIGDSLRNGIAHLDANYNVTSWNSNVLVNFNEIIIRDGYIFGRTYNSVNAIDLATGNVLPWTVSPYMGTYFYSMEYIGGYLYIGGDFTSIYAPNLAVKRGIVQINPATGIATTWSAFSSGTPKVYSIHVDNDKLYVGGNFTTFSGWSRNRIARATVSGSTVTVDSWNPNANGEIYDIETSNTKVLVLGAFTTIAGNSRQGVALMNKVNTTLNNFNPGSGLTNSPDYTKAKFLNGNLYLVFDGLDVTIGTNKRSYLASFDTVNFNLRSWVVNPNANAFLNVANGNLYASGNYTTIGFVEKSIIAAVDPTTLNILNWSANINGIGVNDVTIAGNKLFASGNLLNGSGVYYDGIQIFNSATGAVIPTTNQINGSGYLLDYNDGYVYTSRFFGDITSPPDLSLSRIDTATLNFDMTFNPTIESTVNLNYDFVTDCEFVDSLVYFSGYFNLVQGQQRTGVACLDLTNLQLTPMSVTLPTNTSQIYIESNGDDLIILGSYFLINSQPRSFLSSVNRFNGNLNSWSPNFNQPLVTGYIFNSLEIKDNFVYVGGDFNYGSQIQKYGLSSFSLNNNSPASLSLSPFSFVNDLCFSNNRLHVVGDLTSSNNSGLSEKYKVFDICNIFIDQYDTTYNSNNYVWNGILCQQSGLYYYSTDNPTGCDSNYILHLTILPAIELTQTLVKCNSYTWPINGLTYSSTGVYYDTLYNTVVADTNYTLNLTIVNEYNTSENQVNCNSYTWPLNNIIYFNSGVYIDTIQSLDGCDSIVSLNLSILNSSYSTAYQTACDSFTWIDGITYYSNNNTATHIIPNAAGCDSIITLNLSILQSTNSIDSFTVCDSLTWMNGMTYYANNNTATHILPNATGCDSIITLNLTILQPTYGIDTQTGCDSLTWIDGITYYSDNTIATHIIPNSAGCDSIITLNLTILQSTNSVDSYTVCDSITWIDGITYYSNNTTATHILPNSAGCDSIITLNLTIIPSQQLILENSFSLPSDANNCIGQAAITVSGNADFELNIDNGLQIVPTSGYSVLDNLCPGVHDLKITDNCGDTLHSTLVIPVDSNYVYNNPYLDSIAVDSLGATISNCTIYYNSIDTAYIDSIWSVGNVVNVIWNIVDATGSNYDTTTYNLNNGNGVYLLQLNVFCPTKALGEYFTVTEAIYFENGSVFITGIDDNDLNHIEIQPNPTNDIVSITSANNEIKRIIIYDLYGKELQKVVQNESVYLISLNDKPTGIYLLKIITSKGQVTKRVLKQ